jgi:hypothetical protein
MTEKIYRFGVQVVTDPRYLTNEEDTPNNELLDKMLAGERPVLIFSPSITKRQLARVLCIDDASVQ